MVSRQCRQRRIVSVWWLAIEVGVVVVVIVVVVVGGHGDQAPGRF